MLRKLKSPLSLFSLCFLLIAILALNPLLALAAPSAQTATAIRVNQVGYLPNLNKLATVVSTSTSPLTWQLKNSGGTVVASGSTTVFGNDAASGEQVHIADFSSFTTQGTGYTLVVGSTVSNPFDIGPAIYHTLKYDALAYYYQTRSGIAITMPYAVRTDLTRPAGHIGVAPNQGDTNVPCASDAGCSYSLNVSGGWYDAGDQGKYVVNGGISVWTLMDEYERTKFLGTSSADFANGKMNIPENGNGVPDILDEARWEMEFLLKMQVPTGQPHAGMAHHKMHDANWTGIPQRPEQDSQPRVLRPVSTAATLNLAATAAQCARIWASIDATFSNKCLTAAQTAWTAAQANPSIIASGSDGTGGGAYGDNTINDEFYWAAAELYVTTGSSTYLNFLTSSPLYKVIISNPSSMNWGSTQVLGDISLAVVPNSLAAAEVTSIRNNIVAAANAYVNTSNSQGYRVPFAGGTGGAYYWGDNSDVANNGVIMALAYDFTGGTQYLNGANEAMNYLLGRNAMSKSYVSGYGENPLLNPHHRFWAKQADASFPSPPAGVMAGGPDSGLDDPYAQANLGGCKPQKCYVDNYQSYSTNEEAINWNAPLAWLAAYLDEKGGGVVSSTPTPTPSRTFTPTVITNTPTRTNTPGITNTPTLTRTISPTLTRTATPTGGACVFPTQEVLRVSPVTSPTSATTQVVTVTLNNGISATVTGPAGSFTLAGSGLFNITVNLVQNSTNNLQVQGTVQVSPGCTYTLSTSVDTNGNPLSIVQTSGVITSTPTRTSTPTIPPVITNTPTRTFTPTTPPVLTNTPTQPTGGACTPTSTITAPFTWDGAGVYCWQIATIPGYVNNWNNNAVSINGTNYTNVYVASGSLPAKINNNYYISFNGSYAWSHLEVR
jgi:endoglucanase